MIKVLLSLVAVFGLSLSLAPTVDAAPAAAVENHVPGQVRGKISAIHPAHHSFEVTELNGNTVNVLVTPSTKIQVDGAMAKFKDLAVGQKVRARGEVGPNGGIKAKTVRARN